MLSNAAIKASIHKLGDKPSDYPPPVFTSVVEAIQNKKYTAITQAKASPRLNQTPSPRKIPSPRPADQ